MLRWDNNLSLKTLPHNWSDGWSNDWAKFDELKSWVAPVPLWIDNEHVVGALRVQLCLKYNYHILGEPVPLLYDVADPRVIFRIGTKLYLLMYEYSGSGRIEDIYRIQIPLARLLSGTVSEHEVTNSTTELLIFGGRVDSSRSVFLRRYRNLLKFAEQIGFVDVRGRAYLWSWDEWLELCRLHDRFLEGRYDRVTSTHRTVEERLVEIRSEVVKGLDK